MSAIDYRKAPWKHPAVWPAHIVVTTGSYICDVPAKVATCECGWAACVRLRSGDPNAVAFDDAINDHWLEVIAAAELLPA